MLLVPLGANFKSGPLPKVVTNRSPERSKANPCGSLTPEAKMLLVPAEGNLKIVLLWLLLSASYRALARRLKGTKLAARPATVITRRRKAFLFIQLRGVS